MSAGGRARVLIFAKAPVPGQVKTRLTPALSRVAAARVYEHLLRGAVKAATAAGVGEVWLLGRPDCEHPALRDLVSRHGLCAGVQTGQDLGERMFRAMHEGLSQASRVLLVGSDLIDLRADDLRAADRALQDGADVALAPTADGGYGVIAARRIDPALFDGISWSTPEVFQQTLAAARGVGLDVRRLRILRDLDVARDLALVPAAWSRPS